MIMISFASEALRVIAISSVSQPNSLARSRLTLSTRGSSTRHMCSTGSSLENRRSLIIASSTWLGVGLQPPLLRLIIVRSESNARWISAQYVSSSASAVGDRSPAMELARKRDRIACSRNTGCVARPAAASPERNSRLVVISASVRGWVGAQKKERPPRRATALRYDRALRPARCRLLILDVERLGIEHQNFGRRQHRIALLGVVVVKELESGELHRLRFDVGAIRIVLEPRLAPAVHVDDDLDLRIELDPLRIGEHFPRESVHDQHFRRKVVLLHET